MQTYIALLRGINVSGHNKIKMADLRQLFNDLGYKNAITYIQTGNIIFHSEKNKNLEIAEKIRLAIEVKFGHSIKVIVLTKNELNTIFNSNPFIKTNADISKLYVTILNDKPKKVDVVQLSDLMTQNNETFKIIDKAIYLHFPNGYGNTKLNNNLFEKKLKTAATSRNWKTFTKLIELSNQ
jgi:uncharacterized protein (DUF1697 family)